MAESEPDEIDLALQKEKLDDGAHESNDAHVSAANDMPKAESEGSTAENSRPNVTSEREIQSNSINSEQAPKKQETGSDSSNSSDSDSSSESDSEDLSDADEDEENVNLESDNDTEIPRTRNELAEDTIPTFPPDLTIDENTSVEPIGHIKAVGDRSIVISANNSARYRVLADGAALIIDSEGKERVPLGVLYETFGPVDKPFYVVKFQTEDEIEPFKSRIGESVSQVVSTAHYLLTDDFKIKGTDASNFNDEEVPLEEQEFSDDEQETLAKSSKSKKRKRNKKPSDATQTQQASARVSASQPLSHQSYHKPSPFTFQPATNMATANMATTSMPPTNLNTTSMPSANMPSAMTPELMQQWYQFQQYQQYQYQMYQQQAPPPPPPY